jgi:hypothetical protein
VPVGAIQFHRQNYAQLHHYAQLENTLNFYAVRPMSCASKIGVNLLALSYWCKSINLGEIDPRCQFHQHLDSSFSANFFAPKKYDAKLRVQKIVRITFEKDAYIMFVKLTPNYLKVFVYKFPSLFAGIPTMSRKYQNLESQGTTFYILYFFCDFRKTQNPRITNLVLYSQLTDCKKNQNQKNWIKNVADFLCPGFES